MNLPSHSNAPHLLLVSQKCRDIKIPPNGQVESEVARTRRWFHKHGFFPGEKVTGRIIPIAIEHGVLHTIIDGWTSDVEANIKQQFTLNLPDTSAPLDAEHLFSMVKGARVDDGGNVQNSILNATLACLY